MVHHYSIVCVDLGQVVCTGANPCQDMYSLVVYFQISRKAYNICFKICVKEIAVEMYATIQFPYQFYYQWFRFYLDQFYRHHVNDFTTSGRILDTPLLSRSTRVLWANHIAVANSHTISFH